jgi:hypothetical protein
MPCCRIELKHGGRVLATNTQKFYSDGSSNTFHVFFDQPVQIEVSSVMMRMRKQSRLIFFFELRYTKIQAFYVEYR